jgi:DNA-binding response OmpR family regulator
MTAILVVESDAVLRDVLCEALRDEGYDVQYCDDIDLLPACPRADQDTLALVDAWGGSYAELDAIEREHIQALAARLPTIMLTGRAWAEGVRAEELGLRALLRKPADIALLLDVVAQHTSHPMAT